MRPLLGEDLLCYGVFEATNRWNVAIVTNSARNRCECDTRPAFSVATAAAGLIDPHEHILGASGETHLDIDVVEEDLRRPCALRARRYRHAALEAADSRCASRARRGPANPLPECRRRHRHRRPSDSPVRRGSTKATSTTSAPKAIMSRPATAFASYHTCSSANVAGTRKPYHRFGRTRRAAIGQPSATSRRPSAGNSSSGGIWMFREIGCPPAGGRRGQHSSAPS